LLFLADTICEEENQKVPGSSKEFLATKLTKTQLGQRPDKQTPFEGVHLFRKIKKLGDHGKNVS